MNQLPRNPLENPMSSRQRGRAASTQRCVVRECIDDTQEQKMAVRYDALHLVTKLSTGDC